MKAIDRARRRFLQTAATAVGAATFTLTGGRVHRVNEHAGHNLPEEAPREFAEAVLELSSRGR